MTKRIVSLLLAAVLLAALFIPVLVSAEGWVMYVYTDNGKTLNVRREPTTSSEVMAKIDYGTPVSVRMTMANGWACIDWASGDGFVAYVQSRFLVSTPPAPKPASSASSSTASDSADALAAMNAEFRSAKNVNFYTVEARPSRASGWVNLRWAPSAEAHRIATCPQGKKLTVLVELKNWYQVQDPETGMIGFVSRKYVTRR